MAPWLIELTRRDDLLLWLASESPDPEKSIRMILRGDSPRMRVFIPEALDAAKKAPGRIVLWIRDENLLTDSEKATFFDGGPEIVGVVVSGGSVRSWLYEQSLSLNQALQAFNEAE